MISSAIQLPFALLSVKVYRARMRYVPVCISATGVLVPQSIAV
jgi:hypothetical protein